MSTRWRAWLSARLAAWVALCARHPWRVLAACLALGLAGAAMARGLGFRGDFAELLPESADEVRDLRFVEERAGGVGYLVVQLKGGEPGARARFAERLAAELEAQPSLVRYVEHRFDAGFFRPRALWLLPVEKLSALREGLAARLAWEKRHANPLIVDLTDEAPPPSVEELARTFAPQGAPREALESRDGTERYLFVKPAGSVADLDFDRRLIAAVETAAAARRAEFPGIAAALTGSYVVRVEEDDAMRRDLGRASVLSVVLALGIIVLATRRVAALAVVFLPVAVGVAVTFALARLTVGHLNPITGFLAAVLVGLGIESGVHLVMRFSEERRRLPLAAALEAAVLGTANGAATSAFTNAAAFAALGFAQFAAFRQFGLLAAVGVLATAAASYALGPALLVLFERASTLAGSRQTGFRGVECRNRVIPLTPRPPRPLPRWLGWALVASVGAFAAWSLGAREAVGFETDLRKLRGASRSTDLNVHVNGQLGVIMNPAILHLPTLEQATEVARLARAHSAARGEATSIDRVVALGDLLPVELDAHRGAIAELEELFQSLPNSLRSDPRLAEVRAMLDAQPWTAGALPPEVRRRFTALEGGGHLVLVFPRYQSFDTRETFAWADDLSAIAAAARARGLEVRVLDGNRLAAAILRVVRADGPGILLRAAVAVFLMIWLSLRRLRDALLVAGPLFAGLSCLAGVMALFGLRLNFFNIVLLPTLLSIAIDNSVHLFHRYREEGPGSVPRVVQTTGLAALAATFANAAGYAALLVAGHTGLQSIAWLAIAGVGCAFAGTTVLFPTLLALREGRSGAAAASRPQST